MIAYLSRSIARQSGVTLIVGLVMLLLLTIIGLAAIRGANLEERMAGSHRDRALAFQSAEAALRAAETVLNGASLPAWNTTGYGVQVARGGSPDYWSGVGSPVFNWSTSSLQVNLGLEHVSSQPRYFVERINSIFTGGGSGSAVDFESQLKVEPETMYRVTARAAGGSSDTTVILQSTYRR